MKDIDKEDVIHWLFDLMPHVNVSHHHTGEIKLKLLFSGMTLINKMDPDILTEVIPGILSVKTNWISRSFTIGYDPEELPYDVLEDLFSLKKNPDQKLQILDSIRKTIDAT